MTITELIIAALAVWQIIEIWHHGRIFARWRAHVELWEGFFGELLVCAFCMAPWVAAGVVLVLSNMHTWLRVWDTRQGGNLVAHEDVFKHMFYLAGCFAWLALHAFAVARLANLGNDLTYAWCRTPERAAKGTFEESTDDTGADEPAADPNAAPEGRTTDF